MAAVSTRYPNFAAEMARTHADYGELYKEIGKEFGKSSDTVSNWITGRAGELPTKVAFAIRDRYFKNLSVDYLFSSEPMVGGQRWAPSTPNCTPSVENACKFTEEPKSSG